MTTLRILAAAALAAAAGACSSPASSPPDGGAWETRASPPSGVAAAAASRQAGLEIGCRRRPAEVFATLSGEGAGAPALWIGETPLPLQRRGGGWAGSLALTPDLLGAMSQAGVSMARDGRREALPKLPDAVKQGCLRAYEAAYAATAPQPDWMFSKAARTVTLAYGLPESDFPGPTLRCAPGSGRVSLSLPAQPVSQRVRLASGRHALEAPASSEPDQLNGGVVLTVETEANHAVLLAFYRTGELRVLHPAPGSLFRGGGDLRPMQAFRAACAPPP